MRRPALRTLISGPASLTPSRRLALLLLLLLAGSALADNWTIQTAAFNDYRQAAAQVAELRSLGFDSYAEFSMNRGQQYTRVRIGCFTSRAAAESFSRELTGKVTAEAVPQPLSDGAPTRACVEWDTGFLKPDDWRAVRLEQDAVFRVELDGQVGYVRHDGTAWSFGHQLPQPPAAMATGEQRFRERPVASTVLVRARLAQGGDTNVCVGKLLWQRGLTAVVERPNAVIACTVHEGDRH